METVSGQQDQQQQKSRPYRSKRQRPCDVCRRRKHACILDGEPPCSICRTLNTACTFNEPPGKRRRHENRFAFSRPISRGVAPDSRYTEPADPIWELNEPFPDTSQMLSQPVLFDNDPVHSTPPPPTTVLSSHHGYWRFPSATDDLFPLDESLLQLHQGTALEQFAHLGRLHTNATASIDEEPDEDVEHDDSNTEEEAQTSRTKEPTANERRHVCQAETGNAAGAVIRSSQPIHSLDEIEGFSVQYFGLSGEMDPYVLRHFRFADEGTSKFFKVHYRRLASESPRGYPTEGQQIPVHFMLSANELLRSPEMEAVESETIGKQVTTKESLDAIIAPEIGARLVGLFLRYVFPSLPVLSRSRLELKSETLIPRLSALGAIPPFLLAAVYALGAKFCRYDPVLSISYVYTKFPTHKLWPIVRQGIMQESHTPHLSVLQAALLYLQMPQAETATSVADPPFRWSMLGFTVFLATSLGLHLDCLSWSIPAWEKRIRRRLWWIVYSETTWRSLLLGYPHPIPSDQWDVGPLRDSDFVIDNLCCPSEETNTREVRQQELCPFCHLGYDFRYLASLATIAYDVYAAFYTLAAARKHAQDFASSFAVAQPLLEKLGLWQTALPPHLQVGCMQRSTRKNAFHTDSSAYLRLAFLTLEVLVYRAMFRPLDDKVPRDTIATTSKHARSIDNAALHPLPNRVDGNSVPEWDASHVEETLQGAITWLNHALSYAQNLTAKDRNSFWYSWSRIGFATISNFIILLLIQATSAENAQAIRRMLDLWTKTLREQGATFDQMHLGLLRLDSLFCSGFERVFRFPEFVKEVLQNDSREYGIYAGLPQAI
ncbi:hypothetical protein B7463_g1540, partial [Scytalidium lignicola]